MIQISPPDRFGLASLGISVDVTREAVRCARLVIAQINPKLLRTHGDSFIHVDDIDFIVSHRAARCREERTIYYRFFHNINVFTRQMAQKHWANLDYRKNISLAGVVRYIG